MNEHGQTGLETLLAIGLLLSIAFLSLQTGNEIKGRLEFIRRAQSDDETGLGCCRLINQALAGGINGHISLPGACSIDGRSIRVHSRTVCPLLPGPVSVNPRTGAIEIRDF